MGCHWNVMTLDVIFWHLFWSKKTSKFYGNVMTFWWNSTGFLWEKGILVKCHENVMKFQCHSMGLKILVHFDGILMEKVHGIVMAFDVILEQNSDGIQWRHFIMRGCQFLRWNFRAPCKKCVHVFSLYFQAFLLQFFLLSSSTLRLWQSVHPWL